MTKLKVLAYAQVRLLPLNWTKIALSELLVKIYVVKVIPVEIEANVM
jgi:hypothetical protein